MKITNFEATGLDKVEKWIKNNKPLHLESRVVKEVLKTVNISFVAEEIDRIQSTLLCELKDSYVQQSQRYVTMKDDSYILPELEEEDRKLAQKLTEGAFQLYDKMAKLKEGDFKGRPKIDNYQHGIPIEDARYILPLSTKTNLCIALSGDKLYQLFSLINDGKYEGLFKSFKIQLYDLLPKDLICLLPSEYNSDEDRALIESIYQGDIEKINFDNNMVLLDCFDNLELKVGLGALTSTQTKAPSEVLMQWGDQATNKARGVAERVLGYGHDSIAEQARTTFGMMCSMVTYHQQIRHRLTENHREDLTNLIVDEARPVIIPKSIEDSIFREEYLELVGQFKEFRLYILEKYGQDKALPFLLNCDQIKLIISSNARIDVKMLAERICLNAQWEIRELATKKLMILRDKSSVLYDNALPSCVLGKCKEGKLSCGSQVEMRGKFLGSTVG